MENYNVFAGAFVDRNGERRKDPDWLSSALINEDSRFVPIWGERCLVGGEPQHAVMLERRQIENFVDDPNDLIFLGLFHDRPAFAFAISPDIDPPYEELGEFRHLRFLGTVLPPDEANLAAHARALVIWHASQMFCGICGSSARSAAAGNSRICANKDCGREIFPRVDPAKLSSCHSEDPCCTSLMSLMITGDLPPVGVITDFMELASSHPSDCTGRPSAYHTLPMGLSLRVSLHQRWLRSRPRRIPNYCRRQSDPGTP